MGHAIGRRGRGDVGHRDRDDHAIQRLPGARALQQTQEGAPAGLVDRRVAVLRGVTAGGIDEHRVLGKPPIAHPRAADAGDRVLPHFRGKGEFQASVQKRGGLAGAGRPDDRVPRLFIQIAARPRRLFQQRQRGRQLFRHRRHFFGGCLGGCVGLGAFRYAFDQCGFIFPAAAIEEPVYACPKQRQHNDQSETRPPRLQKRNERPKIPNQRRDRRDASKAHEPAGQKKAKDAFHDASPASATQPRYAGFRPGPPAWRSARSDPRPPALRPSHAADRQAT